MSTIILAVLIAIWVIAGLAYLSGVVFLLKKDYGLFSLFSWIFFLFMRLWKQ